MTWWLIGTAGFLSILFLTLLAISSFDRLLLGAREEGTGYVFLAIIVFFGLMTISLARKWMPFVRLTEKICRTLGIPDPSNVDLVKSSKAQRQPDDPGEYGTFYFRY